MLRIIYIDGVVLYIWKKSGRFNDMKYHGSYNKEFILYKFHFIWIYIYKVEEYGHSLLAMDLDGYVCKDIYIYRTIYL